MWRRSSLTKRQEGIRRNKAMFNVMYNAMIPRTHIELQRAVVIAGLGHVIRSELTPVAEPVTVGVMDSNKQIQLRQFRLASDELRLEMASEMTPQELLDLAEIDGVGTLSDALIKLVSACRVNVDVVELNQTAEQTPRTGRPPAQGKTRYPLCPLTLTFRGRNHHVGGKNQGEQFGLALALVESIKPSILYRYARHCAARCQGGRVVLSQDRFLLYPNDARLCQSQAMEVPGNEGWWYGTNYSYEYKKKALKAFCHYAGVKIRWGQTNGRA